MGSYGLTDEVRTLRERMRKFIDEEVVPAEKAIEEEMEDGGDRSQGAMAQLKESAKRQGLWALGHPEEIGGGGLPFMSFVYLNEVIGRSEYGQVAVGSLSMQDSIMLHLYASDARRSAGSSRWWPARSTRRWASPSPRSRAPIPPSCRPRPCSTETSG